MVGVPVSDPEVFIAAPDKEPWAMGGGLLPAPPRFAGETWLQRLEGMQQRAARLQRLRRFSTARKEAQEGLWVVVGLQVVGSWALERREGTEGGGGDDARSAAVGCGSEAQGSCSGGADAEGSGGNGRSGGGLAELEWRLRWRSGGSNGGRSGGTCAEDFGPRGHGLRIPPPEATVTGYMFGKGVYFADMFSKSANYCCASKASRSGVLLLCEGFPNANCTLEFLLYLICIGTRLSGLPLHIDKSRMI
ncbi:unnamed protein product [Urochloa humidicola]